MYDQTGSTDSNPFEGFKQNPNAGFNQGFQGQSGQHFDPNMFKSHFSGFNTNNRAGMGGFQDLFGDIFNQRSTQDGINAQTLMLALEISFNQAVNGVTKVKFFSHLEYRI